jgi:hypothetical protein
MGYLEESLDIHNVKAYEVSLGPHIAFIIVLLKGLEKTLLGCFPYNLCFLVLLYCYLIFYFLELTIAH